jgi:hypothetical protein
VINRQVLARHLVQIPWRSGSPHGVFGAYLAGRCNGMSASSVIESPETAAKMEIPVNIRIGPVKRLTQGAMS